MITDFAPREVGCPAGQGQLLHHAGPFRRPSKHCFHPGEQFAHAEWFDDVIVRAQPQAVDAIGFFTSSGQYNQRQGGAGLACLLEDLKSALAWQDEIEHEQIKRRAQRLRQTLLTVGSFERGITRKPQGIDDPLADR